MHIILTIVFAITMVTLIFACAGMDEKDAAARRALEQNTLAAAAEQEQEAA